MKKIWIFISVIALGTIAMTVNPPKIEGQKSKLRKAAEPIPNRYVVALDPIAMRSSGETSEKAAERLSHEFGASVDRVFKHAVSGFSAEMSEKQAEALSRDPNVLFVEEDAYISVEATQQNAPWGLDRVDQRNVPLNSAYTYVKTGTGVHVYVIDTGIRSTHVDFGGRASKDFDSMYDGQNGNDCHGHGSHVAATIGGNTYGVAKNTRIHGIRVLGCNGIGTIASAVEGIDWVTANHIKPAVANMSMGSNASLLMDFAVQGSISAGVSYVVAAGNAAGDACNYSPARLPSAITVGATDQSDTRASFSNYGSCVDLFAPGVAITSAWAWNDYATFSANGTSMATPHVAGTVALFLEDNPQATPTQVTASIMGDATSGTMGSMSDGSPNLMVFTAPNAPTSAGAIISGRVETSDGRAIRNVRVVLRNAAGGEPKFALTNAFGYYKFEDVPVGEFYTLATQNKQYYFPGSPYAFTLGEDFTAMAFVGFPY
ncbi:MAG TPA: S8 family serine peptidase [Pyrinomonadaceae bacterium]|nr:S8 family serine peptidase [Pyrinomonadaceae bacterium]